MKSIAKVREGREERSAAGRPPLGKDKVLSDSIMVMVTQQTKTDFDKKSKASGTTMSEKLRAYILDEISEG